MSEPISTWTPEEAELVTAVVVNELRQQADWLRTMAADARQQARRTTEPKTRWQGRALAYDLAAIRLEARVCELEDVESP